MSNPLSLASAWAALSIPFGPGEPQPITFNASVHPRLAIDNLSQRAPFTGLATPFGYVYDPDIFERAPWIHQEEQDHIRQWEALGPAFPLALGLTGGGDPFEPYDVMATRQGTYRHNGEPYGRGVAIAPNSRGVYDAAALDNMWMPPAEMERGFPQFRATFNRDGSGTTAEFMPGYREGIESVMRLLQSMDDRGKEMRDARE